MFCRVKFHATSDETSMAGFVKAVRWQNLPPCCRERVSSVRLSPESLAEYQHTIATCQLGAFRVCTDTARQTSEIAPGPFSGVIRAGPRAEEVFSTS